MLSDVYCIEMSNNSRSWVVDGVVDDVTLGGPRELDDVSLSRPASASEPPSCIVAFKQDRPPMQLSVMLEIPLLFLQTRDLTAITMQLSVLQHQERGPSYSISATNTLLDRFEPRNACPRHSVRQPLRQPAGVTSRSRSSSI